MAEKWLPRVELTGSGLPILFPSELDCSSQASAELTCEENPSFVPLKFSSVTLTTHRLIFIQEQTSSSSSSLLSSFALPLASVVHIFPLKKSIKSMFASPRIRLQVSVTSDGMVSDNGSRSIVLTLVLRGKTDPDVFFGRLIEVMRSRAWERDSESSAQVTMLSSSMEFREADVARASGGMRMAGVSGILRKEQEMWESTDRSLQEAFHDLNALMSKAKEMVLLAERMRQKLLLGPNSQSGMANDEEMGSKQEMQDWLLSVGIVSPVTKESAGALYHQQLSRQLADFVKVPLEKSGGMIAVIDVYCLFNRARGTELISPEDLLQACAIWEKIDVHVMLRKFESGVMVVQNKSHRDEEVFERIQTLVSKPDALRLGVSSSDAAIALGIAPALAKEHLLAAESKGLLARDISDEGFRFYVNIFKGINANNIFSIKDSGHYSAWISAISSC